MGSTQSDGRFGSGQFLHCACAPTQAWVRPNPLERKLLMDCIAPASFTHTAPWYCPLLFVPKIAFLRKYPFQQPLDFNSERLQPCSPVSSAVALVIIDSYTCSDSSGVKSQ